LQNHPFAEAQNTMKDYIVASYKVTPAAPTFVEARDALLQVVAANSMEDHDRFGQAFAKRGLGIGAVAPARTSDNNAGVVESFDWADNYRIESVAVGDGSINCDGDGILDPGETGVVTVTIRNIGQHTLTGAVATLDSTTPEILLTGPRTFADIAPGSVGTVSIPISLADTFTGSSYQLKVDVNGMVGTGGTAHQTRTIAAVVANLDEVPDADTDTFSTLSSNWSIMVAPHTQQAPPGTVWTFVNDGRGNSADGTSFQGATNIQADESLVSPPIDVAATGDFTLAFQNLYLNFTAAGGISADLTGGVVVEVSDDGGATWTDMIDVAGVEITNGYSDVVPTAPAGVVATQRNPLEGRHAFTGANPALFDQNDPDGFDDVSVNFHAAFAGKTVVIRFRYGFGWVEFDPLWQYEVDNVALTGITNHPFLSDVPDRSICVPIPSAGEDQTVPERTQATLHGAAPDLNGTPVTVHWVQTSGPAATLSDATSLTPTFTAPDVAADTQLTFRLDATGANGTRSAVTHVLVQDVNRPPVAAIAGNDTVQTGGSVTLNGSGSSDPDGDALTYAWSQTSGTSGSFTGSTTAASTTFVAPSSAGTVTIGLTVTDSKGLTSTTSKTLTVNAKDDGGCNSTGTPASAIGLLIVGAFLLVRRRRTA
ncbi:MAG TPA: PKD domain-containing protein, partial [Myxococcaceae bacterium]|nr:PKD domain-containing protein [Myxococcaceae bacterium]